MRFLYKLLGLAKPDRNRQVIDRLHEKVVLATRQEAFYELYGVQDTFDGRFETLLVLMTLVLRRLRALPAPGPEVAQELVDTMIRNFDITLRQEGIGDVSVPKRIKKYAQAFAGRYSAYSAALDAKDDVQLSTSLTRNLGKALNVARMMSYVHYTETRFETCDLSIFTDGDVPFPDASKVA